MFFSTMSLFKPVFIRSESKTERTDGHEENIDLLTKSENNDCKKSSLLLADEKIKGDCKCP